jgi:outer membrane protein assembly factor BamE (lipoprotein component of BamABCDE complex)
MNRSTVFRAIIVTFVLVTAMTSMTSASAQSAPPTGDCPTGFVPRPPELNPVRPGRDREQSRGD